MSYCAPELLKEGKLTKAADVYSFAMMMWELFSATPLFRGLNSSQVGIAGTVKSNSWDKYVKAWEMPMYDHSP